MLHAGHNARRQASKQSCEPAAADRYQSVVLLLAGWRAQGCCNSTKQ
jgi:hypothetical protein